MAGDGEFAVGADEAGQLGPKPPGAPGQGQLAQRAALLAHAAEIDAARPLPREVALQEQDREPLAAKMERRRGAGDAGAQHDGIGPDHRSSTAKGFTGGWPRSRPTAESSTPRAAARISAAAPAQSRPWQRPMPTRQKALARLISWARFSTVARSAPAVTASQRQRIAASGKLRASSAGKGKAASNP